MADEMDKNVLAMGNYDIYITVFCSVFSDD